MIYLFLDWLDRRTYGAPRADELLQLRRLWRQVRRERFGEEEKKLAQEMKRLRLQIAQALGEVEACRRCARRMPLPHGQWEGGFCCSGVTESLFCEEEVAALSAAGVGYLALRAPREPHAGCAFRGSTGCTLPPRARPNLCVSYLCQTLCRELAQRGDLLPLEEDCRQLGQLFERFVLLRRQRLDDELWPF